MPNTSQLPPPRRGNLKYGLLGLLFLGAAIGLWSVAREQPPAPPPPPPPKAVERVNPMAEPQLELEPEPEPEPEPAAEPEPEARKPGKPRPPRADWDCAGDLPGYAQVIATKRSAVRTCYERRLKLNNILSGSLKLELKVGATGRVVATKIGGSLRDNEVFSCVRKQAMGWQFAEPVGDKCAVMAVPFSFSPQN